MGFVEIFLILLGVAAIAASFFVPEKSKEEKAIEELIPRDKIRELVEIEAKAASLQIEQKTEETVVAIAEKTERQMERISNEKIMAIDEFSNTTLDKIHKNHEEAVFLYDMLNNKHTQVKNTALSLGKAVDEVREELRQVAKDAEGELNHVINDAKENLSAVLDGIQSEVSFSADSAKMELDDKYKRIIHELDQAEKERVVREDLVFNRVVELSDKMMPEEDLFAAKKSTYIENTEEEKETKAVAEEDTPITIPQFSYVEELVAAIDEVREKEEAEDAFIERKPAVKRKSPAKKTAARKTKDENSDKEVNIDVQFEAENGVGNNKETILRLHREGKSNMAIAKELGLGIGEVKLIIDLFVGAKG